MGCGRLFQVCADGELRCDADADWGARFSRSDGRGLRRPRTLRTKRNSGLTGCNRCGTILRHELLLPGRNRHRLREFQLSRAITISGDCRRQTTLSAGAIRSPSYIRHRPVFVAGPAGSKISPNLAGRLAADFADAFRFIRRRILRWRISASSPPSIFSIWRTRRRPELLTTAPYDFYPEWNGVTILNWARRNFISRFSTATCRPDCRTPIPCFI